MFSGETVKRFAHVAVEAITLISLRSVRPCSCAWSCIEQAEGEEKQRGRERRENALCIFMPARMRFTERTQAPPAREKCAADE